MRIIALILFLPLFLLGCRQPQLPEVYTCSNEEPCISPDYIGVTVPVNIAPITFKMGDDSKRMAARFKVDDSELVCEGVDIRPAVKDWQRLTKLAAGRSISVEVYSKAASGWTRYKEFNVYVSRDSIDPYISYRLIAPSYMSYGDMTVNQRCLENYDERIFASNMIGSSNENRQCVNCHSYQNYNPERMQFHLRKVNEGTVIRYDGKMWKVNLRRDSLVSGGVYPAWHPNLPIIAYSTNITRQSFHTRHLNKIEVFDSASDLILYDVKVDKVKIVEASPSDFEVFPCWAPDGKSLYYCSAHFEHKDTISRTKETVLRAEEIRYNIYRKTFDPDTRVFGPRELVFCAEDVGKSATLPRISPDGQYLMVTLGNYGVFHIWHHEADLYIIDLQSDKVRCMSEINSDDTESYHSWSSNGRWIVFSSRRNDGNYTRLYFAHIDSRGICTKPFELPHKSPSYHKLLLKSYNVPEFMKGPVNVTPQAFAKY